MPKSKNPLSRSKNSPSPISSFKRQKQVSRNIRNDRKLVEDRLDDVGLAPSIAPPNVPQDVVSLTRYAQEHAFEEIPDRAAGMNSERISETLRFRKALPPFVSIAHLHALSVSTTDTERELARLIAKGKIRKATIPGRGKGVSAVGESVALAEDWKSRIRDESAVSEEITRKYVALMDAYPASPTAPTSSFTAAEVQSLVLAGYMTNPAALSASVSDLFARPGSHIPGSIAKAGSSAASGTLAAIGGQGAVHDSGGGGSALATKDHRQSLTGMNHEMTFSLPSTGSYLKMLTEARLHLLHLVKQLSPRYKEATLELLREKWNGNTLNDATSKLKRMRGDWTGVLPGKTKRWREFYGLEFDWILAECVGSGLVELFDTGSVGIGVRAI